MDMDEFLDGGFEELMSDDEGEGEDGEDEDEGDPLSGAACTRAAWAGAVGLVFVAEPGRMPDASVGAHPCCCADNGDDDEEEAEGAVANGHGGAASEEDEEDEEELAEEARAAKGGDPVAQDNKRLRGEVSKHKAQLQALKDKDPEFWA